ncbi:cation diffusion facilitator family transporter [Paenibacillus glacialis]|uniref:Cation transporter n=1 Tax=Paenibacillus glacialis TaxID=494026 RepID=A0A162LTS9_9BACL|nr:cation diffusion facilitator family transporter [Paenibacillus glacialis]OAB34183.1 cation transporter [Paenibacillus glacialis]
MTTQRSALVETVTWTGIICEFGLAFFKGIVGYFSGSKALLGDALYSATEASTSLADKMPWKWQAAVRGNRKTAKATPMITILFSVLVLMGGLQIATNAIMNLSKDDLKSPGLFSVIAIFVSLAVREAIFQFQYRVSKKRNEGKHTVYAANHRLGLYSSFIVLLGVILSFAGDMFGWPGLLYMDSIAGLIVSVLVLRKGYLLIVNSVYGRIAHQEIEEENSANFIDTVQRVHGIITVDDLKSQEHGHYIVIYVKVSVNPRITVLEAQDIADRAKKLLMNRFLHVSDVNIQVVPYDPGYPYKSNHELTSRDTPTFLQ